MPGSLTTSSPVALDGDPSAGSKPGGHVVGLAYNLPAQTSTKALSSTEARHAIHRSLPRKTSWFAQWATDSPASGTVLEKCCKYDLLLIPDSIMPDMPMQ